MFASRKGSGRLAPWTATRSSTSARGVLPRITAAQSLKCPIELDRDTYLKRTLALKLLRLDELEEAFREKALVDRDVAAGALLVKVAERRATLLGLNPPLGHAVQVVQHEPPTSTQRIRAVLDELMDKRPIEPPLQDDPEGPETPKPH